MNVDAKSMAAATIEFRVFLDQNSLAAAASERIIQEIRDKPDLVMGLPTGRTPLLTYRKLVEAHRRGAVSFSRARIFSVDEYVGLGAADPGSFAHYMARNLYQHIDVPPQNTHIPDGRSPDPQGEAARYESLIEQSGGIEFMMLGVGRNGHIGFNEPGSAPDSRTRVVELSQETLAANSADLPGRDLPRQAITLGLGSILEAQRVLVIAAGPAKRAPLARLLQGGCLAQWPVAALRHHTRVTVFCDQTAAP